MSDTACRPPPRPASTVLLLRDGPAGPELFMVVRHRQIEFAAGALVFPGGRVEPADAEIAAAAIGAADPLGAFRVAAIREAFEESGLLLARTPAGRRSTRPRPPRWSPPTGTR